MWGHLSPSGDWGSPSLTWCHCGGDSRGGRSPWFCPVVSGSWLGRFPRGTGWSMGLSHAPWCCPRGTDPTGQSDRPWRRGAGPIPAVFISSPSGAARPGDSSCFQLLHRMACGLGSGHLQLRPDARVFLTSFPHGPDGGQGSARSSFPLGVLFSRKLLKPHCQCDRALKIE